MTTHEVTELLRSVPFTTPTLKAQSGSSAVKTMVEDVTVAIAKA
jgi:hypothetical protein